MPRDSEALIFTNKHIFRIHLWSKLEQGDLDKTDVDLETKRPDSYSLIMSLFREKSGIAVLWRDGYCRLPTMASATRLQVEGVEKWHCIVKVDKNRYAVSGLNQTTDPYTQVIKLVDSQLRPVSTVTFRLRNCQDDQHIERLVEVSKRNYLGVTKSATFHVLLYRKMKDRLAIKKANLSIPASGKWSTWLSSINVYRKCRVVVGSTNGQVAIIKLTFH